MESLSDQLHDNLLLSNNVELTDEDNRVKNVEHSSSDGDTKSGDHDGEKIQNEVTATGMSDSPSPDVDSSSPQVCNAQMIPNYDSQLSEATSSSELSKLNQLDIISPNANYDSLDLASNRIEAARSHQSQHSAEELASPPRPLSCADGLTSQEYEQFVLSVLNVNICKNEKDRVVVEWIEEQLADFMADDRTGYKRFDEMTSYHRMLVHRVAEYYRLYHHVDQSGKCVVVSKQTATINSPAVLGGQGSTPNSLNSSQNLTSSQGSPGATSCKINSLFGGDMNANTGHAANQSRASNQLSPGGGLSGCNKSANMTSSPRTSSNSSVGMCDSQNNATSTPLNGAMGSNMMKSVSNTGGQRYSHSDRGHKNTNSSFNLSGSSADFGVIASTGGSPCQYANYGGLKKKSAFPNVNKRMPTYSDQAAFGGPRKTLGGCHSQASQQGTGRYGANFGDSSGLRPRNPNSNSCKARHAGVYDSVNSVPSMNNNRMRYPNKGAVHGNQSNHHNFSTTGASNAQVWGSLAGGGAVSVSSNAPFGQMLPASAFPFPNLLAKPDGSLAAAATVNSQMHGYSLPEDINAALPAGGAVQINLAPSGFPHTAFGEPTAMPFNWVYAPHNAAAAAAALQMHHHTAAVPNVATAGNNYMAATPASGAFYPATAAPNMANAAGAVAPNVPLGINMQMPSVQHNMGNSSSAVAAVPSSGSNSAKPTTQQQLVQTPPPSNSSSSAMNDLVKTGNTSSIPQGPPSTTKTAVSGDATALNVSTPTTVTGQKGSQHTTGSNKNKFLNQRQQQASLNNNNTNNTASKCTSPDGDNVAESVDSQTADKELSTQSDLETTSGENMPQGALRDGTDTKVVKKDPSAGDGTIERQLSGGSQPANNPKEPLETSGVNFNGSVSGASSSPTAEKLVASSTVQPNGPVYSVVAGTNLNGYPVEQIGVPLTNLPNAWNASNANAQQQQLMQIPNLNMATMYQQQLMNAAVSKNQLAAMNMAVNHAAATPQGPNPGAAVLQSSSSASSLGSNQLAGPGAFNVGNPSGYYGFPIIGGQMYQPGGGGGFPLAARAASGVGSGAMHTGNGGHGAMMFPAVVGGSEQQHGMNNFAMGSQQGPGQTAVAAASISSNQQCQSIIPFFNHNQVTGAVAAYPNAQIASEMQPYLKHLQYQQVGSSSQAGATTAMQSGPNVGGASAAGPFMQQMSPAMTQHPTQPLAQTTPSSNSFASPNTLPLMPPSSTGATGQHLAASFNTFHGAAANPATLARMSLQQTGAAGGGALNSAVPPQPHQSSPAQQHLPRMVAPSAIPASIPLYQTPPHPMYSAAAASNAAAAAASALYGPAAYTYGMLVSRMQPPHNTNTPVFTSNAILPAGIYPNASGAVSAGGLAPGHSSAMQGFRSNAKGQVRNNAVNGAKSPKMKNSDLEVSSKSSAGGNVASTQIKSQ